MISEPMTTATDYALALVTLFLGWRLWTGREHERARLYWALAFGALALGAALGGTFHGFALQAVWKPTLLAVGLASLGMVCGSAYATTAGVIRHALFAFAWLKFVLFAAWISGHDQFIWVIADTAIAFAMVAALHALHARDMASRWILAGVGLSVVAGAAQASQFDLHPNFTHNDVYHLIQLGAMFAYFAGARRLADRR